jgi:hypothetical protein
MEETLRLVMSEFPPDADADSMDAKYEQYIAELLSRRGEASKK